MNTSPTLQQFKDAKAAMVAAGWIKTHSIMHDGSGNDFGTCFIKINADGSRQRFYVNKNTWQNLPI